MAVLALNSNLSQYGDIVGCHSMTCLQYSIDVLIYSLPPLFQMDNINEATLRQVIRHC